MTRRSHPIARTAGWVTATLAVTGFARTLAYALQPGLSAEGGELAGVTGGPSVWAIATAAVVLAALAAVTVTWLASLAVSERRRLEPAGMSAPARISAVAVLVGALALFAAGSLTFALLESFIHWRAGLGWHGLHCLTGPVHRDAIPLLAGLSLVVSAVVRAGAHLLAWMRRVVRLLSARKRPTRTRTSLLRPDRRSEPVHLIQGARLGARGPPSPSRPFRGRRLPSVHRAKGHATPMNHAFKARRLAVVAVAAVGALVVAAGASAHAIVSPPLAKTKALQQFTLSVPTEKEGATTTKIELTVPAGFAIDSFEPSTGGWKRLAQTKGTGEDAVVQRVTWSGGAVPTGEDSVFRFNASTDASKTYTFDVRQTYSDGTVVDWNGPESSDTPAPTVQSLSSFGGGSGSSTLAIVALVLGGLALVLAIVALVSGRGRSLT
jgi:uncharacterized protein YcnI